MKNGNMYKFTNKCWNPLGGECSHKCGYCYVDSIKKRFKTLNEKYSDAPRLYENEFKLLGKGNCYFICSMTDLFSKDVPREFIKKIIDHCNKYDNQYLFQTKNPARFHEFKFPENSILCTTVETNRYYYGSKAPATVERLYEFCQIDAKKMITIEPIIDFDIDEFLKFIRYSGASQINIGADSKGNNLSEPSKAKLCLFIEELKKITNVYLKKNLDRLLK